MWTTKEPLHSTCVAQAKHKRKESCQQCCSYWTGLLGVCVVGGWGWLTRGGSGTSQAATMVSHDRVCTSSRASSDHTAGSCPMPVTQVDCKGGPAQTIFVERCGHHKESCRQCCTRVLVIMGKAGGRVGVRGQQGSGAVLVTSNQIVMHQPPLLFQVRTAGSYPSH
jgi:hypothetical protein